MILRWLPLILFVVVFAPGFVHAQPRDNSASPAVSVGTSQASGPPSVSGRFSLNLDKMYEDIEIMRRILDRKLRSCYPQISFEGPNTRAEWTLGLNPKNINSKGGSLWIDMGAPVLIASDSTLYKMATAPFIMDMEGRVNTIGPLALSPHREVSHMLEGVYLKGQGIVYTATLASLQPPGKAETAKKSVSEWESVRRQVRNEKEEPKKTEADKPASLSDVLLEVLAANGHHFSQLGENESVTIVLTVHEMSPPSAAAKSNTGTAKTEWKTAPAGNYDEAGREESNFALLGELHLKQAKYTEAIAVFKKWLVLAKSPKQEAEARRKLAQCYIGLGEDEKAHAELDKALELRKREIVTKVKPAAAKPAAALPVKLIISAPKKLLDQVGEGKIPIQDYQNPARDFFHQATVETLRFGDRR